MRWPGPTPLLMLCAITLSACPLISRPTTSPPEVNQGRAFCAETTVPDGVVWTQLHPKVIARSDPTAVVTLQLCYRGALERVTLEWSNGQPSAQAVILSSNGDGLYTAILSAQQVLFGYDTDDQNHQVVGRLNLQPVGQAAFSINVIAQVADENTPPVGVRELGEGVRATDYVVNIVRPTHDLSDDTVRDVVAKVIQRFGDEFDFINVVSSQFSLVQNRTSASVSNQVTGIGRQVFDTSNAYGSHQVLKAIIRYPIGFFFDLGEKAFSHEVGHQWMQGLGSTMPIFRDAGSHWPVSTLARGLMGFSIQGSRVGGNFDFEFEPAGNNQYRLRPQPPLNEFTDLDLYLMGLVAADQVQDHQVLVNQNQQMCNGCLVTGPLQTVTINDVLAANGPRVPPVTSSQKAFRAATVLVSAQPLSDLDLAYFDHFARRGEARTPLAFTSGLARGTTKPFFVATRGLASMTTRLRP